MGGIKRVGGTGAAKSQAGTPATADPADVHAMRAAMAEEPGEPPLSSLFSAQGGAAGEAEAARAVDPDGRGSGGGDGDDGAEDLAADVARRVLVTDRDYSDDEEVRIYLKDSVLKDTEVHLRRTQGGLAVRVQTGDRGSHLVLLGAKEALARRLEASCQGRVRLDIVFMGPKE